MLPATTSKLCSAFRYASTLPARQTEKGCYVLECPWSRRFEFDSKSKTFVRPKRERRRCGAGTGMAALSQSMVHRYVGHITDIHGSAGRVHRERGSRPHRRKPVCLL